MRVVGPDPSASRAVELLVVNRAEADGLPYLALRDDQDRQRIAILESHDERVWLGRGSGCDIVLDWDEKASRSHAELVRVAEGWAVVDDGLSRNGTFVNGKRIVGRRRLHDGDVIRCGASTLSFRAPAASGLRTDRADDAIAPSDLTPMQRKVLAALCRPLHEPDGPLVPASNRAIADELVLSVEGVKTHMRALFARFGVDDLPQNQKRARVAELALRAGLVPERQLNPE